MFLNESETLYTSEGYFTEKSKEITKHLRNLMQSLMPWPGDATSLTPLKIFGTFSS